MPHHSSQYCVDASVATDGIVWSVGQSVSWSVTIVSLQNGSTD